MAVNVSAPFPQIDLPPGATITVTLDDPAAVITALVVHGWQEEPEAPQALDPVKGAYLPGPVSA